MLAEGMLLQGGELAYNRHVRAIIHRIRIRYRYPVILLRAMVISDMKLRYQASILGYLWTILRPLAIFSILYVVFAKFIKLGSGVQYYAIYLLLGIVFWGFFLEMTTQGLQSIVARASLLRRINFPRYVVVLSVGAYVLISFVLNLVVLAVFMIVQRVPVRAEALYLIPLFMELLAVGLAVTFFLSAFYVRFRDVDYIWQVFMQAAFYITPILYPLSLVPERWARLLLLNPVAQIIQDARYAVVTDQTQTIGALWGTQWVRAVPVGITLVLAVTSVIYFRRRSRTFAEEA